MAVENYTNSIIKKVKTQPMGENDKFCITPIVWSQVLTLLKDSTEKKEVVAIKGPEVKSESILSTELAQGKSIKAYDGTLSKSQEDDYTI